MYQPPVAAPVPMPFTAKPPCWGKSFEESNRECRGCGFQASCKDQILKDNMFRQSGNYGQPTGGYRPYAAPAPAPIPVPVAPWQPPAQRFPLPVMHAAPAPVAQPPAAMVNQNPAAMPKYGYGWVADPLFYALNTAPPLMRPQFPEEGFVERVVKNTVLSMLESFMREVYLAVRQMIWAPGQDVKTVPGQRIER